MKNLGLKRSIRAFIIAIVVIFLAINVGYHLVLNKLDNSSSDLYEKNYQPLMRISQYLKKSEDIKYSLASFVAELTPGPATANVITRAIPQLEAEFKDIVRTLHIEDKKTQKEYDRFKKGHVEFMKLLKETITASNSHDKEEIADILDDAWVDSIINVFKPMKKINKYVSAQYVEQVQTNLAFSGLIKKIALGAAIIVILFVLAGMFFIMKKINTTVDSLVGISEKVKAGTVEISAGNQDLSSRTQEQASNLQETASNLQIVSETVKQTSTHAAQALELSTTALRVSTEGGEMSQHTNTAMQEITKSSQEIADIITLVEEIAFQTNILAINAAIEAAKAGEQGKGFAVVAIEVRDLAQRSADAAKDIKDLIDASNARVNEGSRLVIDVVTKLDDIKDSVGKVSDIMQDISTSMGSQEVSISEINNSVAELDEVTQRNSALVEEIASASESMTYTAETLNKSVNSALLG